MMNRFTLFISIILLVALLTSCTTLNTPENIIDTENNSNTNTEYIIPMDIQSRLKPAEFQFRANFGHNLESARKVNMRQSPIYITLNIPKEFTDNLSEFVFDDNETLIYNCLSIDGIYPVEESFILNKNTLSLLDFNLYTVYENPKAVYTPRDMGVSENITVNNYKYIYISENFDGDTAYMQARVIMQICPDKLIYIQFQFDTAYEDLIPYILNSIEYTTVEECTCELHKNVMNIPREPLLIPHGNKTININIEEISNMLHLSGTIYKNISNFMPYSPFIFDDKVENSYAYIPFEISGGNNSGVYILVKFNLNNRKIEGILKLPRQNIYLNQVTISPTGENLVIVTAYNDLPIHFNTNSKLNLFLSIINLNSMSVDHTFKFETQSNNDTFTYDFAEWIDDNNLAVNLLDSNGVLQTEFLNIECIYY